MKKSNYLFILAMFITIYSFGQHSIGIRAGFNLATMNTNLSDNLSEYTGMSHKSFGTLGLLYKASLDENWAISTGINYARRGAETKLNEDLQIFDRNIPIGVKLIHKMDYIEIPILFEYRVKDSKHVSPYLLAGAYFAYEIKYNMQFKSHFIVDVNLYNYNIDLTNSNFKRFDISGVIGAGVYIPLATGNLNFDVKYLHGFTDILSNTIVDLGMQHSNIRMGMSYYYPINTKNYHKGARI